MSGSDVIVVGGGLAGLTAAIRLMDQGVPVVLLEGRARLGGATWSTRRSGFTIDNGQHVFLRCCTAYRDFIERLGVSDRVTLQPRLDVPIAAADGSTATLRRSALPPPLHLAPSLLRFRHLPLKGRLRAAATARRLGEIDLNERAVDERSFGAWLRDQGESDLSIDCFWDLLIRPTLNLPAREASLSLAAKVFQTGLLTRADGADIGYALAPLSEIHGDPARRALERGGARIYLRARVDRIEPQGDVIRVALKDGESLSARAVILAVDHEAVADLVPTRAEVPAAGLRALGSSPIMNLHVVFDRAVMSQPFLATTGMRLQWIFDRSRSSGLDRGQYLAISLSAADEYMGLSIDRLRHLFLPEIRALFPASRDAHIEEFFATREPAATFLQKPGTLKHRPGPVTALPGFFLAGAWTDTGWPATMEGAVLSGEAAARSAVHFLRSGAPAYARSA